MITNRKTRWFVAFVGVLICALAYGLIRGRAQSSDELYVEKSSCTTISLKWNDVPADNIPTSGGLLGLYCPWGNYYWQVPYYLLNEGQDYWFFSMPGNPANIPDSGNNWGSCLIQGYKNFTRNSIPMHKYITYPAGFDGYLDCDLKELPMIMNYGPRLYNQYSPYPGPEDGMSGGESEWQDSAQDSVESAAPLDSPYP